LEKKVMATKSYFADPSTIDDAALIKAGILAYRTNSNVISSVEVARDKDGMIKSAKLHQLILSGSGCQYMIDGVKKLTPMSYSARCALDYRLKPGSIPVKEVNLFSEFMGAIVRENCDLQGNNWFTLIASAYLHCRVLSDGSVQELSLDYWLENLKDMTVLDRDTIISKIGFGLSKEEITALKKVGTVATPEATPANSKNKQEVKQPVK
jgi:hypothetical protein